MFVKLKGMGSWLYVDYLGFVTKDVMYVRDHTVPLFSWTKQEDAA